MVSGTLCVLTEYEVVIRQRQLLVCELIALGPQLARGKARKAKTGVKTGSGESEANCTYWSATGLLFDELFLEPTDSLLGNWVFIFVLNATDFDGDVQVVERVVVGHGLKARGGIHTYNCSWAVKWVDTNN